MLRMRNNKFSMSCLLRCFYSTFIVKPNEIRPNKLINLHLHLDHRTCYQNKVACKTHRVPLLCSITYRVGHKRGHRLMTIILSVLNRFKFFLLEDSLVNLQWNGYIYNFISPTYVVAQHKWKKEKFSKRK